MQTRFWSLVAMVVGAVGPVPAVADASEDFSANNENICLVSQSGVNKICITGGSPTTMDVPYEVNAGGGYDIIRIRSSVDCSCTCSGSGISTFIYDGDVDIDGEADHDDIYGAYDVSDTFSNTLRGGGTYDYIRGGSSDGDILYGDTGNDIMYDPEGADETYHGGGDSDTMRDNNSLGNCVYNSGGSSCDLQRGTMYQSCAILPALCDGSSSPFTLSCP